MKTKKIIISISLVFIALFAFVGCTESSLLNSLVRSSNTMASQASSYETEQIDNNVELLSLSNESMVVMTLSEDETPNYFILANELRLELIALHNEILVEVESIRTTVDSIRTSVQSIQERSFVLLPGDEDIIRAYVETIKGYKTDLAATRGEAYQRLYDLRGSYTRDNLEHIVEVFQEVKEVLEYRLEILREGVVVFQEIDTLLLDYMES